MSTTIGDVVARITSCGQDPWCVLRDGFVAPVADDLNGADDASEHMAVHK
jgi:hypothetical protein